jgi:membrane-associated phospholipid phosphatase
MGKIITERYKPYLNKAFIMNCVFSLALLVGSFFINFYAGLYATEKASNPVTDIVLSNTRVYDVDGLFVYGSIALWIFVTALCLYDPKKIPLTAKSIALFVLVRSVFISLTHLGPFPTQVHIDPLSIINYFSFGGDLFFSGHTGLPFLMALLFWEDIRLRIFFILTALAFGAIVLLAHLHYSIDVLAAFFITYSIFCIAARFFRKDYNLFKNGLNPSLTK